MKRARTSGLSHALRCLSSLAEGCNTFTRLREAQGGLSAPTASRLLKALTQEGWAEKKEGGSYQAGPAFYRASRLLCGSPPYLSTVETLVTETAQCCGETTAYVEWGGDGFIFRAKEEMPDSYHHLGIGEKNLAPLQNGFGQAFFPWLDPSSQGTLLAKNPALSLADLTENGRTMQESGLLIHQDRGLRFLAPVFSKMRLYPDSPAVEGGEGENRRYLAGILGISILPRLISPEEKEGLSQSVRRGARAATERINRM